jgi:hypothetical protein
LRINSKEVNVGRCMIKEKYIEQIVHQGLKEINVNKTCKIINNLFSWILNVDNESIIFEDRVAQEYFKKHYEELGYKVIIKERK